MAVKHLQNVQRQQLAMAMATDPSVLRKFKSGFNECAVEIDQYISKIDGVDNGMKQRISSHLQKCINGIEQLAQLNFPGFSNLSFLSGAGVFNNTQNKLLETGSNAGDQNNNPRIQIPQGIQLIPSRLPSGELALLVPNSNNLPYFPTQNNIEPRTSAFAAVIPSNPDTKPLSPPASPSERELLNPSPHGFRPVLPSKRPQINDHQIAQVSSTSMMQNEVKNMKFPIHKYPEKDPKRMDSPKKIAEPLCIITNQSERYKQAQMREESANFEENLVPRGIKRPSTEPQGLLTVVTNEPPIFQPLKLFKPHVEVESNYGFVRAESSAFSRPVQEEERKPFEAQAGSSKDTETTSDMWRPW